jgi:CRP-like cAMP-binding protein
METKNKILTDLMRICPPLRKELRPLRFARDEQIAAVGSPISAIIFPDTGLLVRAVQFEDGSSVATSMVGYGRGFGVSGALSTNVHLTDCFAVMGGTGWSVSVKSLRELADQDPEVRARLSQHEHVVAAQVHQWAACATKHSAEHRLVTFLDRMVAQSGARELIITQERMAELLGFRRSTLSMIAHRLKHDRLVDYSRGRIVVSNDSDLLAAGCPCCAALRDQDSLLSATTSATSSRLLS